MTIHLPEELEQFVQMKVRSGRFASEEDAIGEAVRLLRQQEETRLELKRPPAGGASIDPATPAWKRVLDIMSEIPDEVFSQIPTDSSEQLDHYIYGSPRRPSS